MDDAWLEGRVAVVTGASGGIGRASAMALAEAGAHVVLAARRTSLLEETADRIGAGGGRAVAVTCDVSRPAEVERLFARAEEVGEPTALVCAAGVLRKAPLDELTPDAWNESIAVNLTGAFLCVRRAFTPMRRAGGGRIVLLSSLSGVYGTEKFPGLAAYGAAKGGLVALAEAAAVDGREAGIGVACLSPGAVDTDMLRAAHPGMRAGLLPEDVGRLIVTVLGDMLPHVSGTNIPLFSNR